MLSAQSISEVLYIFYIIGYINDDNYGHTWSFFINKNDNYIFTTILFHLPKTMQCGI